jgi:hypothetical protein
MDQQHCRGKLRQLAAGTLEMTEYVINQVGLHQWLVFADRQSIAFCASETEAVKVMTEHSARTKRSRDSDRTDKNPPAL